MFRSSRLIGLLLNLVFVLVCELNLWLCFAFDLLFGCRLVWIECCGFYIYCIGFDVCLFKLCCLADELLAFYVVGLFNSVVTFFAKVCFFGCNWLIVVLAFLSVCVYVLLLFCLGLILFWFCWVLVIWFDDCDFDLYLVLFVWFDFVLLFGNVCFGGFGYVFRWLVRLNLMLFVYIWLVVLSVCGCLVFCC